MRLRLPRLVHDFAAIRGIIVVAELMRGWSHAGQATRRRGLHRDGVQSSRLRWQAFRFCGRGC